MIRRMLITALICCVLPGISVMADTLVLKDGRVVQGTFTGGTLSAVSFESDRTARTYPVQDIVSLTFQRSAPAKPPTTPDPAVQPAARRQAATGPTTVNAGTRLMVRTELVLLTGKAKTGDRFTAILEADLVAGW